MIRKIFIVLLVAFAGMQFIRPPKNLPETDLRADDLFTHFEAPVEVKRVVERACYDCHSNQTRYPWYAEIQPGGWLLAKHVRDGKRHLNFSEFGQLTPKRAKRQLEACVDEITDGKMPLGSYTWIHRDARLTDEQVATVSAWIEATTKTLEQKASVVGGTRGEGARSAGMD
jgi:hypothetical protein